MQELPLYVFTLFTQLAAGIVLFVALRATLVKEPPAGGRQGAARPEARALAVAVAAGGVALIASLFHLGDMTKALNVLAGLGRSWLSCEVVMASLFFVLTVIALVCVRRAKAALPSIWIAALLGVALSVVEGIAYAVTAVPAWGGAQHRAFVSGGGARILGNRRTAADAIRHLPRGLEFGSASRLDRDRGCGSGCFDHGPRGGGFCLRRPAVGHRRSSHCRRGVRSVCGSLGGVCDRRVRRCGACRCAWAQAGASCRQGRFPTLASGGVCFSRYRASRRACGLLPRRHSHGHRPVGN